MTHKKRIFSDNKKISRIGVAGVLVTLFMGAAGAAATNYGCDDDRNDRIVPELALCTVHAYNIGRTSNDFTAGEKELMRDVIALKTTVMTQQMYKQYEYLESTVRRFKTQLEKAVLTTKLQMAGASSGGDNASSSGGGYMSTDKNIVLAGTQNCLLMGTVDTALDCMQSNVRNVINAVNSGNTSDARKQLLKDLDVATTWGVVTKNADKWPTPINACNTMSAGKRETVLQCAQQLNVQLANHMDKRQNEKLQRDKK